VPRKIHVRNAARNICVLRARDGRPHELDYVAVLPKYKQVGDPLKLLGEIGEISNEPHGLSGFDHVA
jgi:hypothetical protein